MCNLLLPQANPLGLHGFEFMRAEHETLSLIFSSDLFNGEIPHKIPYVFNHNSFEPAAGIVLFMVSEHSVYTHQRPWAPARNALCGDVTVAVT